MEVSYHIEKSVSSDCNTFGKMHKAEGVETCRLTREFKNRRIDSGPMQASALTEQRVIFQAAASSSMPVSYVHGERFGLGCCQGSWRSRFECGCRRSAGESVPYPWVPACPSPRASRYGPPAFVLSQDQTLYKWYLIAI